MGVASVGGGVVSVEAAVAGMVGGAWAESAGVGVMSVARLQAAGWSGAEGASDGCGEGSGVVLLVLSMLHGRGLGRGDRGSTGGLIAHRRHLCT
jgi:hypothetical protein